MNKKEMGAFGKAVLEASKRSGFTLGQRKAREVAPTKEHIDAAELIRQESAREAKSMEVRGKLSEAVAAMDVVEAQKWMDQVEILSCNRAQMTMVLFGTWEKAARLPAGCFDKGDDAVASMLLWLDAKHIPMKNFGEWGDFGAWGDKYRVEKEHGDLQVTKRKSARLYDFDSVRLADDLSPRSPMVKAYAALARSWADDPMPAARLPLKAWLDQGFGPANYNTVFAVAMALALDSVPMEPKHWRTLADKLMGDAGDPSIVDGSLMVDLLRAQPGAKLDGRTLSLLMVHTLWHGDVEAMVEVAGRSVKPMWEVAMDWSNLPSVYVEDGEALSLMECAAWADCWMGKINLEAGNVERPESERMLCLRVLACAPQAHAAVTQKRAIALSVANAKDLQLIDSVAPELLVPDSLGETPVHYWAREGEISKILALLQSRLAPMAGRPNLKGKTPVELCMDRYRSSPKDCERLAKAWARSEAKQVQSELGKPPKRKIGAKSRRL